MTKMSSTRLAEPAREEKRGGTHAAISVESPGKEDEDEKNQDRVMLMETSDARGAKCQFAIVCDGTSTSPFSAEAAAHVSLQVNTLFEEGGLRRTVEALKAMRLDLLNRPLPLEEGQSELLRSMFEEIIRQKYQSAYQTTFVAVCLKRGENSAAGKVSVKAVGCGDSALFIFREDGELLYNNLNLGSALDPFNHGSPFTPVLPDSYKGEGEHVLVASEEHPEGVHLLLCSDGLYDGFKNFKEIRDWLIEHREELGDPEGRAACLAELHRNLGRKKGDDDISFVWLHPAAPPPEREREQKGAAGLPESPAGRRPGLLARMLAALLRLFNSGTQ